jgi:hypothetical protein
MMMLMLRKTFWVCGGGCGGCDGCGDDDGGDGVVSNCVMF